MWWVRCRLFGWVPSSSTVGAYLSLSHKKVSQDVALCQGARVIWRVSPDLAQGPGRRRFDVILGFGNKGLHRRRRQQQQQQQHQDYAELRQVLSLSATSRTRSEIGSKGAGGISWYVGGHIFSVDYITGSRRTVRGHSYLTLSLRATRTAAPSIILHFFTASRRSFPILHREKARCAHLVTTPEYAQQNKAVGGGWPRGDKVLACDTASVTIGIALTCKARDTMPAAGATK